ncbi:MAG TPA: Rieske 2Fe-2S domain-containing protein [Chloroflexota bacterium]
MLKEENDLLTHTGPGTPCGEMMRRYWLPAALSTEVPVGGAPLPIRLLSEDLVLFRSANPSPPGGRGEGEGANIGLLNLHCSHRGADLSYGRLEDGGLRCIYHGWLYDVGGNCLEQPGEPPGSSFHQKIKHQAYPCHEEGGIIFAYLGPGEPPLFPRYEPFRVPADYCVLDKYMQDCNYLQGNEGNIDSVHIRFLHRFFPEGRYAGRWSRDLYSPRPRGIPQCEETHFGVRVYHSYQEDDGPHININNFIMPVAAAFNAGDRDGYALNWRVPIDDTHHWTYTIGFARTSRSRRRPSEVDENGRLLRTRANRYLQDRDEQKNDTFTGLGPDFGVHDTCVVETEGEIYDRTSEHAAPTDSGIVALRQFMLRAIRDVQEGRDPPHVLRQPDEQDRLTDVIVGSWAVPAEVRWEEYRVQPDGTLAQL